MCQAKVVLDGEEVMKDVILVEPGEGGVYLSRFFEDPVFVPAELRRIDLLKHQVVLETAAAKGQAERGEG